MINNVEVALYSPCLHLLFAFEEPIKADQCELTRSSVSVTGVISGLAQAAPVPAVVVPIIFFRKYFNEQSPAPCHQGPQVGWLGTHQL